jgi:ubiquinone/menaquinone biosynthesis C-methylase UbiE
LKVTVRTSVVNPQPRSAASRRKAPVGTFWPNCSRLATTTPPRFATDKATAEYYDRRAGEYDDWYLGKGVFAERDRPGWDAEVAQVVSVIRALPRARTLDVACGTAFLTRHLEGMVVGLDQSSAMIAVATSRLPGKRVVLGDALRLPVALKSVERVLTGHFYGHLPPLEREMFLSEVRRVAGELVVVDSALRPGVDAEQQQERVLNDGSRHLVHKRYLSAEQLAAEIGGEPLFNGTWFVVAKATLV